jgi:sulfopyruvate decarboxylase subunit alpha
MLAALQDAGVTHVITVPDTHQRSLLALLADADSPELVYVCAEDEAFAMAAGLWVGGHVPLLLIQNAGFFASMNSLRGIALDGKVPIPMLIGEYFRDPGVPSRENALRVVSLTEPTLELWGVPYHRLEHPADIDQIRTGVSEALRGRGPVALLVGALTAEVAA